MIEIIISGQKYAHNIGFILLVPVRILVRLVILKRVSRN